MNRVKRLASAVVRYTLGWRMLVLGVVWLLAMVTTVGFGPSPALGVAVMGTVTIAIIASALLQASLDHRIRRLERSLTSKPSQGGERHSEAPAPTASRALARTESGVGSAPAVTVVVTAWNEQRYLRDAIESIAAQTLPNFRCIVVDDASTDDSVSVALDAIQDDPRFRLIRLDRNCGLAAARNAGVDAATTEYVTFLDGDDFMYPESLRSRLEWMTRYSSDPWVAGVYCQWANVPEDASIDAEPKAARSRGRVSWLTSLTDAPFIATAPLIRRDVVVAVGGFPDVATAEDTLFWNRVLREGYVFEPVDRVGVAYRAKATSMFRRTAADHARLIASALESNHEPDTALSDSAPYAFAEGCGSYLWKTTLVRRLVGALASAVQHSDQVAIDELRVDLERELEAHHLWDLPLDDTIRASATRVARHLGRAEFVSERNRVEAGLRASLRQRIDQLHSEVRERQASMPDSGTGFEPPDSRALVKPTRLQTTAAELEKRDSLVDGAVLLMPAAAYHVDETGPIGDRLGEMGIRPVVVVSDRRWPSVQSAQAAFDHPVLQSIPAGEWLGRAAGIVVLNDWGEEYREYVALANELGVPTFAKVEGVQDFNDDDVHWERRAYQTARWILAQGANDVNALPMKDTVIVSNNRLERIWRGPENGTNEPLLVVNMNFTYGVLEGARDAWIDSVDRACSVAGIPYVISLHPAERDRYAGRYPISRKPIRHLLTRATGLVSRFSTVPFEAMARGVPFVYHNPHGERVPTFAQPNGAFDVTTDTESLSAALIRTQELVGRYREVAGQFFLDQVDVREQSAVDRAAGAIAERLSRG